jgi:hypothetical protein
MARRRQLHPIRRRRSVAAGFRRRGAGRRCAIRPPDSEGACGPVGHAVRRRRQVDRQGQGIAGLRRHRAWCRSRARRGPLLLPHRRCEDGSCRVRGLVTATQWQRPSGADDADPATRPVHATPTPSGRSSADAAPTLGERAASPATGSGSPAGSQLVDGCHGGRHAGRRSAHRDRRPRARRDIVIVRRHPRSNVGHERRSAGVNRRGGQPSARRRPHRGRGSVHQRRP